MLNILKKDRCRRCYNEPGNRNCLRLSKMIGWQCCNDTRADRKCPINCDFALKDSAETAFPAFKAESRTEFQHLIRKYIDFWINQSSPFFNGKSPADTAKEDSEAVLHWLSTYQFPAGFPIKYLMDRLGLQNEVPELELSDPEAIVTNYMNSIIALEWNKIRGFTINNLTSDDLDNQYKQTISAIATLKKLTEFRIISAGISEDGSTSFVFLELNGKTSWTMILTPRDQRWCIRQNINGSPQEYYQQNARFTQIAETLGKGDEANAWHLIEEAKKLYPDSADIYYYSGLHKQLIKQNDKAKVDFFSAIALDNQWSTPYYHLAALYLESNNYTEALYWCELLDQVTPDDPKVMNNIAACHAGLKNTNKAREIWQGLRNRFPEFELAQMNLDKLDNGI